MRVLVACEFSGRVRDAFRALGHDAYSCDIQPGWGRKAYHIRGDVRPLLREPWDLVIAHPPCTYLTLSGVRWFKDDPTRYAKMEAGVRFFRECLNANAPSVCVENPIQHGMARDLIGVSHTQVVHPYHFGHPWSKATRLWLKGLPPLVPTKIVEGSFSLIHNHSSSAKNLRSLTCQGLADAMAQQWGSLF